MTRPRGRAAGTSKESRGLQPSLGKNVLLKGGLQPLARPVSETASSGTAPADGVSGGSGAAPRPGKGADGRHHGARRAEARDPTGADHGPLLNPFCQ